MSTRALTAPIQSVSGPAIEGLQVDFFPGVEGHETVTARTAADGVFVVTLDTGTPYMVGFTDPMIVDGLPLGQVTVMTVLVPEGEGAAMLGDCIVQSLTTGWPLLLQRLLTVETMTQDHEERLLSLEGVTP